MRGVLAIAMTVVFAAPAHAADLSPMEQCAVQWRDLKTAGQTGGQDYRTFTAKCLKTAASAPPPDTAAGKAKRPSRMGQCAAKWRQMKAQDATHDLTYREWTSQCMKKG